MQKQWYDFSRLATVNQKSKTRLSAYLLSLAMIMAAPLRAQDKAEDLAALPAYNIVWFEKAPEKIQVGDKLNLVVEGLNPQTAGAEVIAFQAPEKEAGVPNPQDPLNQEEQDIIPWLVSEGVSNKGKAFQFIAIPIRSGELEIPSLFITLKDGKKVGRTNPFQMKVDSPYKGSDPEKEKPPVLLPPLSLDFPVWVIAAIVLASILLLAAIIYGVIRLRRRKKPEVVIEAPKDLRTEDEIAIEEIKILEAEKLWEKAHFKPHYFGLSEIVKKYIGVRYGFDAPEMTASEIVRELERTYVSPEHVSRLGRIFQRLDLIKFTDTIPPPLEAQEVLREARDWIIQTRRVRLAAPESPPVKVGG